MSDLFAIAGLGNPGPKYAETRHNAGFWFLEAVAGLSQASLRTNNKLQAKVARVAVYKRDCVLIKPDTFMNLSGMPLRAVTEYFEVPARNLLVAYDELDLPPGVVRLKVGGGHGGHYGLKDVFRHVEDHSFLRFRFGIGHPGSKDAVLGYVLGRPSASDEKLIRRAVARAIAVLPDVLNGNVAKAMQELHTENGDDKGNPVDGL